MWGHVAPLHPTPRRSRLDGVHGDDARGLYPIGSVAVTQTGLRGVGRSTMLLMTSRNDEPRYERNAKNPTTRYENHTRLPRRHHRVLRLANDCGLL